jgi:1-acyl-sn-glycerol-3-phosphate acyltransferase
MGKKDKRRKGEAAAGWAWMAEERPSRRPDEGDVPRQDTRVDDVISGESAGADPRGAMATEDADVDDVEEVGDVDEDADVGEDSDAPATARSSELPGASDGSMSAPRIPRLRPVRIELPQTSDLEDQELQLEPSEEQLGEPARGGDARDERPEIGVSERADEPRRVPVAGADQAPTARAPDAFVEDLTRQIKDLEARVDAMIAEGPRTAPGAGAPTEVSALAAGPRATARDLLPQEFYRRQWGRAGRRQRAEEVDEFGHDPQYEARFLPFFDFLYRTYFRVEAEGAENVPTEGRCVLVANHSGGPLPYDGIMLRTAVRLEQAALRAATEDRGGTTAPPAPAARELRWLAEDFVYHLPFVGTAMNRLGAVRACQENAERLLAQGNLVAVFPEGAKGIGKLFRERYQLQRFGRGGFIRLCLRTRTPIVPVAIVGAEEANPMLYRIEYMTKTLGIPYLPITPTFPALGPLGLLPAPTKWHVAFGEPLDFAAYGPEAADDDLLVGRLAERVRGTIQDMLDRAVSRRRSIWFG